MRSLPIPGVNHCLCFTQPCSIPIGHSLLYLALVRRSLISRISTLTIATLVGVSVPGLAVSHGQAHHEIDDHAQQHSDYERSSSAPTHNSHDVPGTSIHVANEPTDHAHPQVADALSVRLDALVFVLAAPSVVVPSTIVFVDAASLLLTDAPARPGDADKSPRNPRAPPLG